MTRIALAGLGLVGMRCARQLVETSGVDEVVLIGKDRKRAEDLVGALGPSATVGDWKPGRPFPEFDAVACARASDDEAALIDAAIAARVSVASTTDAPRAIAAVLGLDAQARAAGVTVLAGAGFAPGLSELLATHAGSLFTRVHEVHVARAGWSGKASFEAVRHARREPSAAWKSGSWREIGNREAQIWFPEPIGARDCEVVRNAGNLVVRDRPGADHIELLAPVTRDRYGRRSDDAMGAIHVEVWGAKPDGSSDVVVYGALDRVSIAAGAVLAVTAARLATGDAGVEPGVHSLAAVTDVLPWLADLAERGVRGAVFEGAPIS